MNPENYKYKTELHLHTSPASHCSEFTPEQAVEIYANLGYNSIMVTNHFYLGEWSSVDKDECIKAYLADFEKAVQTGKTYNVNVILGCEIRFTENSNDYLLFGIDEEFLNIAYDYLDKDAEAFSKECRNRNILFVQAHPFRKNSTPLSPEYLDGIETFNMHPGHNSRVAFAAKYAREHNLIPIAGSDFHHPGHEGVCALLTKTEMKTSQDIVEILQNGDYLFEIGGSIVIP